MVMKTFTTISLVFLCFFTSAYAQENDITHSAPANKFTTNTGDNLSPLFYVNPLVFKSRADRSHDLTIKTADGVDGHGWEVKAKHKTDHYMLVFHEWQGVNDYIKQECERLSNDLDINVIAVDLYDNKVAANSQEANQYTQQVSTGRASTIIKGAYAYAGNDAKVFTIGWSLGGSWSLQAAIEGGNQVVGCIMYYGQPEKDIDRLKMLNCDVIGFFGLKDKWLNKQVVDEFKTNLGQAGKKSSLYEYNADHAFANPSKPVYDKTASTDAYDKMLTFVKLRMR